MSSRERRRSRRHGHLPGHIRDTFLTAIEAYIDADPGTPVPRIPFQINYRDRHISIAEACRLVWTCTDIMPGSAFDELVDHLDEAPGRRTYAAAARALLRAVRDNHVVDNGADARLKRLYDERDRMIEGLETMIAADRGYDMSDRLTRGYVWQAASEVLEAREEAEIDGPKPVTSIEVKAQKILEHCTFIAAIETAALDRVRRAA
jgi:hypothetical protein